MDFFSIKSIFFRFVGYAVSHIEFWTTLTGAVAVWLEARANKWCWAVALVSVTLSGILFFQVQLYSDVFLQVFFFSANVVGWWRWTHPGAGEADGNDELRVSVLPMRRRLIIFLLCVVCSGILGYMAGRLHLWYSRVFAQPSAFPYLDAVVTVVSIFATFLAIQKRMESWFLWMAVNVIASGIYFIRGIKWIGLEYFAFLIIALMGWLRWRKIYQSYLTV